MTKNALYLAIYKRQDSEPCHCCGTDSLNFYAETHPKIADPEITAYFKNQEISLKDIPESTDQWTLKELDSLFEIQETILLSQDEEIPIRRHL